MVPRLLARPARVQGGRLVTAWHIIAVRSVGATAWDALPTACEHPDVVPALVAAPTP